MSSYVTRKTPGDTAWFTPRPLRHVHPLGPVLHARTPRVGKEPRDDTPEEKYDKYFKYFDPDLFDAREWARQAKAAGMKYAVLTTKHHEGFCMFDSQYTDYKCTNTPAGPRSGARIRGRVPRRGSARRLLLLADRLASPGFPDRHAAPAPRTIRTLTSRARTATCTSTPSTCAIR